MNNCIDLIFTKNHKQLLCPLTKNIRIRAWHIQPIQVLYTYNGVPNSNMNFSLTSLDQLRVSIFSKTFFTLKCRQIFMSSEKKFSAPKCMKFFCRLLGKNLILPCYLLVIAFINRYNYIKIWYITHSLNICCANIIPQLFVVSNLLTYIASAICMQNCIKNLLRLDRQPQKIIIFQREAAKIL